MESFLEEMKRYIGFTEQDAQRLRALGPRLDKYLPELAECFYAQILRHAGAARVLPTDPEHAARLKTTLRQWAQGLFTGVYDQEYARERYRIGYRHVRIGLEQRYVISAISLIRAYLAECLRREFPPSEERASHIVVVHKILDLELNLLCESYMNATLENLQALNQQLEEANHRLLQTSRAKDEFLTHVSHELRTPLNSILGFSKMVLDGLCASAEEEQELLRDVFVSGQYLLRLVNDLLDIRRIEEGKMRLHPEDLDLRQVLDATLPLVAVQAGNKRITLLDETLSNPLPRVYADEIRLRQVLLNLLMNAVRFTPKGWVKLRVRPSGTGENGPFEAADRWVRLEIEDTGVGIPQESREVVFEKFAQLEPGAVEDPRGTGLGLAISRSLVEMMGGSIGIEDGSEAGGTLVWFTIPAAPSKEPARVPRRTAR